MPELLIDFITSLDGYAAAADGWPGLWGLEGPEYPSRGWASSQKQTTWY